MYKKIKFIIYIFMLGVSVQAGNWYKYEYDASTSPSLSKSQWRCSARAVHIPATPDGIYKCIVPEGKGWNHWEISGKDFIIPETADGATIEFRAWAPKTQNRGMRLHIEDAKRCVWIMYLKNDGKEQVLHIRRPQPEKDIYIKLPDQFNVIRVVINRKNGRDKASVYLNNSLKPVVQNWIGFGKKASYAKIGFGAYSSKLESGTLLIDYVRWNPEKAVLPVKTEGDNNRKIPMTRVEQVSKPPVIDGILNDQCYKSLKPIKLHTWRKGKSKQASLPVQLTICRDSKKLYLSLSSKKSKMPKIPEKLPRDTYIGSSDTLEIFLDPSLSRSKYYQIALNISNTLYDKFFPDGSWNGDIKSAVKVKPDGWTAELSIDISSLDKTKLNSIWGANFNLIDTETGSFLTWSPIKVNHHEPERFGLLVMDNKTETGMFIEQAEKLEKKVAELKKKYSNSQNSSQNKCLAGFQTSAELLASAARTGGGADKILYLIKSTLKLKNDIIQFEKNCDRDLPLRNRKELLKNRSWCAVPLNSIVKPGEKYCPPLKIPPKINVFTAKGEYESYQLIVYNGPDNIKDGKISLTPLIGKFTKIPVKDMEIWEVAEVILKVPSKLNPFSMPGDRLPDPLIHCNTNDIQIKKNDYKAFRVTIHTPRDIPAGLYKGDIKLQFGDREQSFPVELKVWDFTLPVTPNLKTSFSVWDKKGIDVYHNAPRGSEKHRKLLTLYKNTLLKYRITPRDFPYNFDPENLDEYGKWLDDQLARGATIVYVPFKNPLPAYLPELQRYLEKKGLLHMAHTRSGDEPEPKHFPALIKRTLAWKKMAPKIPNMVAGNNGFNELGDVIDIWCPHTNHYSTIWAEQQRKKGKKVWWYVCNYPFWPYANFYTDHKGIEHRALLWQTYFYKADGLLYWNTVNWRRGNPWKVTETLRQANGDGSLFYPGNDVPLPSLRLEILRDGVDDYDYLFILDKMLKKNKGKIPGNLYLKAKNLLDIKALCGDLKNYSRDSEAYLKRRRDIGNMIDTLQKYAK